MSKRHRHREPYKPQNNNSPTSGLFVFSWTVATAFAWGIFMPINLYYGNNNIFNLEFYTLRALLFDAFVIGLLQWVVLKIFKLNDAWWIVATVGGVFCVVFVYWLITLILQPSDVESLIMIAVPFTAILVALFQWVTFRRFFTHAYIWILVKVPAFVLSFLISIPFADAFMFADSYFTEFIHNLVIAGLCMGGAFGITTGLFIRNMSQYPRSPTLLDHFN